MNTPHRIVRGLSLSLLSLTACALAPDGAETRSAEIVNGDLVGSAESSGVVWLANDLQAVTCSGTLLTGDWVITASHCGLNIDDPSRIQVYMGNYRTDYAAQPNFRRAAFAVSHPGQDFALIRLARALPMPANRPRVGFFTGSSDDLVARRVTLHAMGYGNSVCGAGGCGDRGNLREAWLRTLPQPSTGGVPLNFDVESNARGQIPAAADSGSPIFYDNAAGRFLAGVLKGGNQSTVAYYGRSENVRDWALAYIYGRPVPLPRAWFVPPAQDAGTLAQMYPHCRTATGLTLDQQRSLCASFPLLNIPNSYAQSVTFRPCPGAASYTWSATYNTERVYDAITVQSALGSTVLSGVGSSSGAASGDLTLRVQTNDTVRSAGLTAFNVVCGNSVRYANPSPSPLVAPSWTSTSWDPCPGGETFTYTASYDFPPGSGGVIAGRGFSGTGTVTVPGVRGALTVQTHASTATAALGFRALTAVCDAAIHCHGPTCFTSPGPLPHNRTASVSWTPCNGRPFVMTARFDMERNYDYVTVVRPGQPDWSLTGFSAGVVASDAGTVTVRVTTDGSVSSNGLQELSAQCRDW